MKYTEKSLEFQRAASRWCLLAVLSLGVVSTSAAQEIAWPEPAGAPEQFVGTFAQLDGYERYYDPFRSATAYFADRRSSGTAFVKVAAGQRGTVRGMQGEGEWYPVFGGGSYGYIGYAFGFSAPFPRHRGGLEYFTSLPGAFEASCGLRGYVFRDRRTVTLATGSVAVYVGNAWLSLRPYVSVNLPRTSVSVTGTGRYYLGERDEFAFLRLGAGFTPDERFTFSTSGLPATEVFTLHSQSIAGGAQWYAWPGWLMSVEALLGRQEVGFLRGTYVWNPSVIVGVRYSLR